MKDKSESSAKSITHAEAAALLKRKSSNDITKSIKEKSEKSEKSKKHIQTVPIISQTTKQQTRNLLHWTPEQWQQFERIPKFTNVLSSAKILPIRSPLSSIYEVHFSARHANYSPSNLVETLISSSRSGSIVNLGLVIDATGSSCFLHDTMEWNDWDVEYIKLKGIFTGDKSQDIIVEGEMVDDFFQVIEKHKNSENYDTDIAVYGAFGYNFVGYLIVSYLIVHNRLPLDESLKEFAKASPPGIYSMDYLERLYRKYFTTLSSPKIKITCPSAPKYDTQSEADIKGEKITELTNSILTAEDKAVGFVWPKDAPRKRPMSHPTMPADASMSTTPATIPHGTPPIYKPPPPRYVPSPPGNNSRQLKRRKLRSWAEDAVAPLQYGERINNESDIYQQVVKELETLTGIHGFPGCEAIPLTATHVGDRAYETQGCLTSAYLVTWRARGRRCLLFTAVSGVYVVCRDMSLTKVDLKFPRKRNISETQIHTLLDGILVEDEDQGHKVPRFLAFDILFLDGNAVWNKKLPKRLQHLQNDILMPRKSDQLFDYTNETFRVRMKDHFRLTKTPYLLEQFVKSVTHEVDGVIYTPTEAPYNLGGFESKDPIFKFVASESSCGMPGLDGSISERKLLNYIQSIPQ